ncbi:diguanylate cyclase (GGDEF)-like protein [Mycolicibacterium sp. BK556]|uniref:GGDEF domain-containing protein n=1 Tax=unclassified Mycolicibacterium TaxID=2636767 RepID=UPI001859A475|nr:diguanylate cyclase (GGDEF)-like protein [Mycolicibacterium sp. BK556]MBB3631097.1 diguanylate cyclase (GGDEF)-like protein [Mycolicibacterium sp. BK607]
MQYFTKRAKSGPIQVLIGMGTGFNGVLSLLILLPSARTPASQMAVAVFALLQLFWGWVWCYRPWPSRQVSLAFVISADIAIAAVAVLDTNWLLGLFAFNAFAMLSVLLMFFDGPKVLTGHIVWILIVTASFAAQVSVAAHVDALGVTAKALALVTPVVATPLGIQLGIWALRNDANESVTDPLTGLLNRRGLHLHIGELLREATPMDSEVAATVVDLDRFKAINDTFGHPTGDEVLIRCARRITSAVRNGALVARIGGEEFVVVDLAGAGHARQRADGIRHAIAAPADHPITASVGVTSVAIVSFAAEGVDPIALLDSIVERADQAMFDAKRNGGNATVHIAHSV